MKKGIFILLSSFIALGLTSFRVNATDLWDISPIDINSPAFQQFLATMGMSYNPSATPAPRSDSTKISPPGLTEPKQVGQWPSSTPQPQYPGVTVPTTAVTNEYFSALSLCPAKIVCPDINGLFPPGTSAFDKANGCPNSCRVERTVTFDPQKPQRISGTAPAICPPGYSAVATYKVDKEIARTTANQYATYPITSMSVYNSYVALGYNCDTDEYVGGETKQCGDYPKAQPLESLMLLQNGVIGKYRSYGTDGNCYCIGSNCGLKCLCGASHYVFRYYSYSYKKCYRPAGELYYTNNMIPTGIVCTAAKPTWRSLY